MIFIDALLSLYQKNADILCLTKKRTNQQLLLYFKRENEILFLLFTFLNEFVLEQYMHMFIYSIRSRLSQ